LIVNKQSNKSKSKTIDGFDVQELFIKNNFISIFVGDNINHELLISLLLKPICFWMNKTNNKIMLNNFGTGFKCLCERILSYHLSNEEVIDKLLKQEINFTDSFGVLRNKHEKEELSNYDIRAINDKKKLTGSLNSQTDPNPKLYDSLHLKDETNILNILDASNLLSLLNDEAFLDLLQHSFATNVIIINLPETNMKLKFLEKGIHLEINLVGKNILIKLFDRDIMMFETILDRSRLFVEWHHIL
jgi:hypothetical protein